MHTVYLSFFYCSKQVEIIMIMLIPIHVDKDLKFHVRCNYGGADTQVTCFHSLNLCDVGFLEKFRIELKSLNELNIKV